MTNIADGPRRPAHDCRLLDLPIDEWSPRRRKGRTAASSTSSSATKPTAPRASLWAARRNRSFVKVHDAKFLHGSEAALHDRHAAHLRRTAKAKAEQANAELASMDDETVRAELHVHRVFGGRRAESPHRLQGDRPGRG